MKYTAILFTAILILGCSTNGSLEITDDFSHIENPKERWEAYGLTDYSIKQDIICYCVEPYFWTNFVNEGDVSEVSFSLTESVSNEEKEKIHQRLINYSALTVEEAFSLIEDNEESADYFEVEYHERYGYPTKIKIDYVYEMADDEITYVFSDLQRIR